MTVQTDTVNDNEVRLYYPDKISSDASLILFHGGGLVGGEPHIHDHMASWYAKQLKLLVLCAGYRKAPEHAAPAAIDDCLATWDWLMDNSERLQIDKAKVILGGISAGGGLAACLSQRLLDREGVQPTALLLHYPMLDDRTAVDRSMDELNHKMWNNKSNRVGWTHYLGADRLGAHDLPDYLSAARRTNYSGLPPTWLGVGDVDLFYEESKRYARELTTHGVPCHLEVVPGAPHGFDFFGLKTDLVQDYLGNSALFIRQFT
ncbi:MAG: alpha/beta hydrolase [Pseudomonadota bacterium]